MRHSFIPCLLVLLLSYTAWVLAALPASSDRGDVMLQLIVLIVAILFISVLAIPAYDRLFASPGNRRPAIGLLALTFLLPSGAFCWMRHSVHPAHIRYEFDYGQSGSWHEVQFTLLHDGQAIKGPWIGGYPLDVRFPDINDDGHPDIRAAKSNRIAEFIYLPSNDGHRFWRLGHSNGYFVDYPPDGQHYP